jgi:hypothetical protein
MPALDAAADQLRNDLGNGNHPNATAKAGHMLIDDSQVRQLIAVLQSTAMLAVDEDRAPLDDLVAEQYEALHAAEGALAVLKVLIGDWSASSIEAKILGPLRTLAPTPPVLPSNDYTVRISRRVGEDLWEEVFCASASSEGTPEDAAADIWAKHKRLLRHTAGTWRIRVFAGHGASHLDMPVHTLMVVSDGVGVFQETDRDGR